MEPCWAEVSDDSPHCGFFLLTESIRDMDIMESVTDPVCETWLQSYTAWFPDACQTCMSATDLGRRKGFRTAKGFCIFAVASASTL